MGKKKSRRRYSAEQKAKILKEHLLEKKPVSEVCENNGIQPSLFYQWQRQAGENLAAALEASNGSPRASRERALEAQLKALKAKLAQKDHVIAEISEEYVTLKKSDGNL